MRKIMVLSLVCLSFACKSKTTAESQKIRAEVVSTSFRFNEGNVWNGSTLLVSNFGHEGDAPNPTNTEGKGYISKVENGQSTTLIATNGSLSAPKGMAVVNGYLLIADVQKVVIYNLENTASPYKTLTFPEGNIFVNDIVVKGNTSYISVTNTGKIFKLDMTTPTALSDASLVEIATVEGANGLVIDGNAMYVASYPANGTTVANNVIYYIADITVANSMPEKLITRQGQYDGLAINGNKLFFTNWENGGEVGYVNLNDKTVVIMKVEGYTFGGPADMSYNKGKLYICDLPNSKLVSIDVSEVN